MKGERTPPSSATLHGMPAVAAIEYKNVVREDSKVKVVDHPLVAAKLSLLRDRTTVPDDFRRNMRELSMLLLHEAAREWETVSIELETPLKNCRGRILRAPVVFVPILRAGLGLLDGMLRVAPEASVGQIGLYRDEGTLRPVSYFCRLPVGLPEAQVVVIDPMLATGGSACQAISLLKAEGAKRMQFICVIASRPGIEKVRAMHPDVPIVTAGIDPELNKLGFIVPGLGDAGDRYFGTG
jgi:uracil phosphoribosyltransferase